MYFRDTHRAISTTCALMMIAFEKGRW